MIISKITLNNYRLYQGVNEIEFKVKKGKNIYLVSGENGFGKTTFLHSLIWCLYGRLITEVEAEVRKDIVKTGYKEFLKDNFNHDVRGKFEELDANVVTEIKKHGYTTDTEYVREFSTYSVTIDFAEVVIPSLPCTSIRIVRSYDYLLESESVDIFIDGVKNELTKEIGPDVFINDFILNKDIARFFFFDSEQIVALAETSTTTERRRLGSAYNEVLGVRKYEDLKRNLENMRLRFRKKSSDAANRNRLMTLLDEKKQLLQAIADNGNLSDKIEAELQNLHKKNEELQLRLMREGNGTTIQEIKKIEDVIGLTKKKNEEYKKQLKQFIDYAPFAIAGTLFKDTKVELEKDYMQNKANVNLLSTNSIVSNITSDLLVMVNGISMDADVSLQLQQQIQNILSKYRKEASDEQPLLTMNDEDYEEFMAIYSYVTTTYKIEFEHLADDYKKNKLILERNSRRLSNIQSKEKDELIKEVRKAKNEVEIKIQNKEQEIRQCKESFGVLTQKMATVTKQISELSKIVCLDDSSERKDKLAEQLIRELSAFLVSLKQEKKFSLERRIKAILNSLMHKEDFIGKVEVQIEGDDMDISLFSVEGVEIHKDSLSKGEQQLYATSILKALVDESGIQFPVFIDSPLQKFDKSHASKIITEFYPQISKQVILFPLLYKELTAEEYEVMKPLVNSTYLIKNDTIHSYLEKVSIDNFIEEAS